jgi:hypothetical protein
MGNDEARPPHATTWAPGTLDQTRKNIGTIDSSEAQKMAKVLGGEVLKERTETIHHSGNKLKTTGRIIRSESENGDSGESAMDTITNKVNHKTYKRGQEDLPSVSFQVNGLIDKLMMSPDYKIKQNYGFFNFVRKLQKNGAERILPDFYDITIKLHIDNMEAFITVIKTLIQIAPNTYKAKIANGTEPKFKFLRMVAGWTMQNIKLSYIDLKDIPKPILTSDLIPFIRAVYKPLISIYYYGNTKIPKLIKEIYADEDAYPDAPGTKLSDLAKEAITEWLYIDTEIIHKLYPLLMRMCCDSYEECQPFFTEKVADILKFVGLHKFDLLLPEKPKEVTRKEKPKPETEPETRGKRDEIVNTGLTILEQFFPQAGFKELDSHPDMYPYFQPIYKFAEGFNMLSPQNPLQVTVVLLRIIEDCFQGCRNIKFSEPDSGDKTASISMTKIIDDWSAYREEVFEKLYCDQLKNLVNQVYSQPDFTSSQFGKKTLTSLLWQTNYHFLPAFRFDQLLLERPADDSKYRPLFLCTNFARTCLTSIVNECDHASKTRSPVNMIQNPWEHYRFDIPNEISKRLDVLLGGQNNTPTTNATNANLLKYTLCIIAVLDWWINNPDSPAYGTPPMQIYRISETDGKPSFSTKERFDQNKLFADEIKTAYQHRTKNNH